MNKYKGNPFTALSCLLMCSIQMCVNTMLSWKDIFSDLREENAAAHQSGKVYKANPKQFDSHQSTMRNIIHKHSRQLLIFPELDVQANPLQGQTTLSETANTEVIYKHLVDGVWVCFAATGPEHLESTKKNSVYQSIAELKVDQIGSISGTVTQAQHQIYNRTGVQRSVYK